MRLFRGAIVRTVFIFLTSYVVFLFLWIPAKDYYAQGVVYTASKLAAGIKSAKFEELTAEKDLIHATFSPLSQNSLLVTVPVKTSSYTFNAPLSFAILASIYLFLRNRKRACAEAFLMLLLVHLIYVFSLEAKDLTDVFAARGIEKMGGPFMFFYQFLWSFTDNMVIRFEPFLIGFIIFMRFRAES
jgi:hypothetical protein